MYGPDDFAYGYRLGRTDGETWARHAMRADAQHLDLLHAGDDITARNGTDWSTCADPYALGYSDGVRGRTPAGGATR
mgnify:CR=1 FL=1